MLIDGLYRDFLTYQDARGCSAHTLRAYGQDFRRLQEFLAEAQVPSTLESLTGAVIRRYLVWLRERGYSQWSVRRRMVSLRAFLTYCVDEELLARHPMTRVPTPKAPSPLPQYLTLEEVQRVLRAVDGSKSMFRLRDRALVRVLLFVGPRRSELLGMTWRDIDFPTGTLKIYGKGKKERCVPLDAGTLDSLLLYRNAQKTLDGDFVWHNRQKGRMAPDSLGRAIRRWLSKAGITKDVTPHTFRHTFATLLVQNGTPLTNVRDLLGHTDISTTGIYSHSDTAQGRRSLERLIERLSDFDRPDTTGDAPVAD